LRLCALSEGIAEGNERVLARATVGRGHPPPHSPARPSSIVASSHQRPLSKQHQGESLRLGTPAWCLRHRPTPGRRNFRPRSTVTLVFGLTQVFHEAHLRKAGSSTRAPGGCLPLVQMEPCAGRSSVHDYHVSGPTPVAPAACRHHMLTRKLELTHPPRR
jgi:hypothetical protein